MREVLGIRPAMSEAQVRRGDATVSLQGFRDAFSQQWRDDLQDRGKELRRAYRGNKERGPPDGPTSSYSLLTILGSPNNGQPFSKIDRHIDLSDDTIRPRDTGKS